MKIKIIAIGKKLPTWMEDGIKEYKKRLSGKMDVQIIEISPVKRVKGLNVENIKSREEKLIFAAIPRGSEKIMLDERGKLVSTVDFARSMELMKNRAVDLSIIIGGPDGLSSSSLKAANDIWSLSKMTFPHHLVRLVVLEQLYRAWSINNNHPYHRV